MKKIITYFLSIIFINVACRDIKPQVKTKSVVLIYQNKIDLYYFRVEYLTFKGNIIIREKYFLELNNSIHVNNNFFEENRGQIINKTLLSNQNYFGTDSFKLCFNGDLFSYNDDSFMFSTSMPRIDSLNSNYNYYKKYFLRNKINSPKGLLYEITYLNPNWQDAQYDFLYKPGFWIVQYKSNSGNLYELFYIISPVTSTNTL